MTRPLSLALFVTLSFLQLHAHAQSTKLSIVDSEPDQQISGNVEIRVVAKFNHPGDGTKSHGGLKCSEVGDKAVQLMEVRKPDEEKAYIRALNQGWHNLMDPTIRMVPTGEDHVHGAASLHRAYRSRTSSMRWRRGIATRLFCIARVVELFFATPLTSSTAPVKRLTTGPAL